jgi:hypothetical protein
MDSLPNLTVMHRRIENSESPTWDLTPMAFNGGTKISKRNKNYLDMVYKFPVVEHRVKWLVEAKEYLEGRLDIGELASASASTLIERLAALISFCDEKTISIETGSDISNAFYKYSEYQFSREQQKKIKFKQGSGYKICYPVSKLLSAITELGSIDIKSTRLKQKKNSRRAISREADKMNLEDAANFAKFAYDICNNFDPKSLHSNKLPILVKVRKELTAAEINLTPTIKSDTVVSGDYIETTARYAFNHRVAFECLIFLAMTMQNAAPTFNLRMQDFDFKPMGKNYEVRAFKNRRGGEVLFKIPKPYRKSFEAYLTFMREYAYGVEHLFPMLTHEGAYRKRRNADWGTSKALANTYSIHTIAPNKFRKIGLNILLRLSSDEQAAADLGNHGLKMFRESYEFPSQQRAAVELTRFWDANDPLEHGEPKLSLFSTGCSGEPVPFDDATDKLAKPDCLTPSGCMGCKNYRDEDSLIYVWNLFSFRYLKVIESSSYLDNSQKPSNIAIDWVNLKIKWFNSSEISTHKEWIEEAQMRIDEGEYHPSWERKIQKYEV